MEQLLFHVAFANCNSFCVLFILIKYNMSDNNSCKFLFVPIRSHDFDLRNGLGCVLFSILKTIFLMLVIFIVHIYPSLIDKSNQSINHIIVKTKRPVFRLRDDSYVPHVYSITHNVLLLRNFMLIIIIE